MSAEVVFIVFISDSNYVMPLHVCFTMLRWQLHSNCGEFSADYVPYTSLHVLTSLHIRLTPCIIILLVQLYSCH